jgi:DNA-binding winged helix-turn-helix (wHTH) protein/Tol biopolymer transport system component
VRSFRFASFDVHMPGRELYRDGIKVKLRGQPFRILEILASRAGEVVTREELCEKLWPSDTFVDFEHGLNASVRKLRQTLGDSAQTPRYIETLPGVGYRFVAAVEVVAEEAAKTETGPSGQIRQDYRFGEFVRRHTELLVGALILLVLFGSLAFVRHREGGDSAIVSRGDVVRRQLTAHEPGAQVITATISRDGKYLAYGDPDAKIYLLQIDDGELRQLVSSDFAPMDWFPDGNHLLVDGWGQHSGIWKMSTGDGALRKLLESRGWAVLAPDGLHIAYIKNDSQDEIWLMGENGEDPHRVAKLDALDSVGSLHWSPSGQRLVYVRFHNEAGRVEVAIETCDLQGSERTLVLSEQRLVGRNGVAPIYWLPDGRILYSLPDPSSRNYDIWGVATDTQSGKPIAQPERLTAEAGEVTRFLASADDKRLLYSFVRSHDAVYLGDLRRGAAAFSPRRLTLDEWDDWPWDWTRDGKAILLRSARGGKYEILTQRLDGRAPELLLSGGSPVFSPEGDRILYTASAGGNLSDGSNRPVGKPVLMSSPVNGGSTEALLDGSYTYRCGSVPSAGCVLAEIEPQQLVFYNLDPVRGKGTEIQRLKDIHGFVYWSLSPDGSRIAVTDPAGNMGDAWILTLADHEVVPLTLRRWKWGRMQSLTWSADGSHLFATALAGPIVLIDLHGNLQVLAETYTGVGRAWLYNPVASPDGHYLAYMKRTLESNVMMLEHF